MSTYHIPSGPRSILKDPNASGANIAIWKKVCFDDVHIREFAIILGDNPAVSKGAPLQIDWEYHNEDVVDVDIFEHCRAPVRRHRKRIVLSARKRAKLLLSAGHTVEEIADMTLQCQNAKKLRVESVKGTGQWDFSSINGNLADFMTGTAEVTGRTLKLVGFDAMMEAGQAVSKAGLAVVTGTGRIVMGTGKVAGDVVLGTGKFATDVVVGTGKLGVDAIVGTGKVVGDVALGTGKVGMKVVEGTGKVVVGTGRVATDVVVGTGQMLKKGTETVVVGTGNAIVGTFKGIGKAPRRITNIFSQGDLIRGSDLKETKQHLRHIETKGPVTPTKKSNKTRGKSRRHTELSPLRNNNGRSSPPRMNTAPTNGLLSPQEGAVMDELAEMEQFMLHLQDLDPDQVKRVLANQSIQA